MEDLEVLRELGRGGFATVFLCRDKTSNRLVAVKRIPLHRLQKPEQRRRASAERRLLAAAAHPCLVRGLRAFRDDAYQTFVMELVADARPLYQCIWRYRATRAFPERVARHFAVQLVLAVEALHAMGFVHRDLKSGNVLVDARGHARVIDYGFARRIHGNEDEDEEEQEGEEEGRGRTLSVSGTHYIMAPEMYLRQPYGVEVDWWGVGVIVHEMVCGRPPWEYKPVDGDAQPLARFFDRISDVAKRFSLGRGDASELLALADVSDACKSFVAQLLQFNPKKRLGHAGGAQQVKAHAWFRGVDWGAAVDVDHSPSEYDPVGDYRVDAMPLALSSSSSADSIDADDNARLFADF